jgi:adenylate kinase
MHIIIIIGPPGSGKGTCAQIISELYNIPIITTGNLLREASQMDSEKGKIVKEYIERGELVPDNIVNTIVKECLLQFNSKKGFILDGYPRSINQANTLDQILSKKNIQLDYVLYVYLEYDIIINRLTQRNNCPNCGSIYHLKDKIPRKYGFCDVCGSELVHRSDDNEDIIKKRFEVYKNKTELLIERYKKTGKMKQIRGDVPLNELPSTLKKVLN